MNVQKANDTYLFGENMTFKKLYQKLFSKMSPVDFRSLGFDHIQQSRPI